MDKARSTWLFILFCTLAPVPAQAQINQINAISVSPSPAQPNQTVTITLWVEGGCNNSNFELNFGDGQAAAVVVPSLIPITHTYSKTGTYTLSAFSTAPNPPPMPFQPYPPPACGGIPTITVPVLPAPEFTGWTGGLYCFTYGCNPAISAMPLALPEPGNTVIFQGSGFGAAAGSAFMVLQSYGGNWPELRVQLQIDPGNWQPGVVVATIPAGIVGVVDQPGTFQIVTAGGSASNAYAVPFTASRAYQDIYASRLGCSMTKNTSSDECLFNGSYNWPTECDGGLNLNGTGPPGPPPMGFWGNHESGWQIFAGANDAGVDTFFVTSPLQNGWLVAYAGYSWVSSDSNSFAYILNPPNLYFGGPTANPSPWQIGWNVSACGWLGYNGDFEVYGPSGVPY
jgi:hypothetical protein